MSRHDQPLDRALSTCNSSSTSTRPRNAATAARPVAGPDPPPPPPSECPLPPHHSCRQCRLTILVPSIIFDALAISVLVVRLDAHAALPGDRVRAAKQAPRRFEHDAGASTPRNQLLVTADHASPSHGLENAKPLR